MAMAEGGGGDWATPPLEVLLSIGLDKRTAENALVNHELTSNLIAIINEAGVSGCSKSIGNLLYMVATKCPTNALGPRPFLIRYIVSSKIKNSTQLDAALSFLSNAGLESFELDKFEEACGQ
ncbi:glutamine--tRNA ligase-like isoform X2 [Ananas comosus]|uniref:Glutamine--tRNA ligase-like isoform X2 n=1 Tax=Ananas comosus TaxID=4615 RepID=A0A6P5FNQ2_ANACO|nr:glutamine--tRNA ligase-like isoform X2 [Ananas comosus]XP_020097937.1 glutamine--tRNA ligase-like isoform X2 [Ananas comosus]